MQEKIAIMEDTNLSIADSLYYMLVNKAISIEELRLLLSTVDVQFNETVPKLSKEYANSIYLANNVNNISEEFVEKLTPKSIRGGTRDYNNTVLLRVADAYQELERENGNQICGFGEDSGLLKVENGVIIIASTNKVLNNYLEKGLDMGQITQISRSKFGDVFATELLKYGMSEKCSMHSTLVFDGTYREGITTVIRDLMFAGNLQDTIRTLKKEKGIIVILNTIEGIYNLTKDEDFARMTAEAVTKTISGRLAQSTNRVKGLSETLRIMLTKKGLDYNTAIKSSFSMHIKNNALPKKEGKALNTYLSNLRTNWMKYYNMDKIDGHSIDVILEFIRKTFQDVEKGDFKEIQLCENPHCNKRALKNTTFCKEHQEEARQMYLATFS